jgi:hypothetical protein
MESVMDGRVWHLLQVSDVLDLELGQALAAFATVIAWEPERSLLPFLTAVGCESQTEISGTNLNVRKLPLLRGYARFPISALARTAESVVARMKLQTPVPEQSPLICTIPYFASVAELWPGSVVYWLTDLMAEYAGANRRHVERLDRRMCKAATLVCPNSKRIAEYLVEHAACDPAKIQVVPNATREANLLARAPLGVAPLPAAAGDVNRPVAGVIGNLAGNMDWLLLEETIERTPWLSWVFVGPTTMDIPDEDQSMARRTVMEHARTHFVGKQRYGNLAGFARAFDVAVLPYRRCEPTYSGSSTRFYEHLAACRPMIATRGFEELLRKEPLLKLVNSAAEAAAALETLRTQGFDDGFGALRWQQSREGTWHTRARSIQVALDERLHQAERAAQVGGHFVAGAASR